MDLLLLDGDGGHAAPPRPALLRVACLDGRPGPASRQLIGLQIALDGEVVGDPDDVADLPGRRRRDRGGSGRPAAIVAERVAERRGRREHERDPVQRDLEAERVDAAPARATAAPARPPGRAAAPGRRRARARAPRSSCGPVTNTRSAPRSANAAARQSASSSPLVGPAAFRASVRPMIRMSAPASRARTAAFTRRSASARGTTAPGAPKSRFGLSWSSSMRHAAPAAANPRTVRCTFWASPKPVSRVDDQGDRAPRRPRREPAPPSRRRRGGQRPARRAGPRTPRSRSGTRRGIRRGRSCGSRARRSSSAP